MLDVLYLVPNTADPAVARRIDMLNEGGARVIVAGFRRTDAARPTLDVAGYHELGETFDARFGQRILAVIKAMQSVTPHKLGGRAPDVIMARNLEMLPLANKLRRAWGGVPSISYECLDIHRLMLRRDLAGDALRGIERLMTRDASLLVTSSPAFVREYFEPYGQSVLPTLIVENKVRISTSGRGQNPALRGLLPNEGPLKIGWFGALRCHRSLDILSEFSRAMNGAVEIVLRGRPALSEFDDFHGRVAAEPFMRFEGPYRNPDDLARIYSDVHFAWAIDYFEAGQNSDWLLPNRIYEGSFHGAIPIALDGTETARFVKTQALGLVLPDTTTGTLIDTIGRIDRDTLRQMAANLATKPSRLFSADTDDSRALVQRLTDTTRRPALTRVAA